MNNNAIVYIVSLPMYYAMWSRIIAVSKIGFLELPRQVTPRSRCGVAVNSTDVKRSWKVREPVTHVAPFKACDGLAGLRLIDSEKNQDEGRTGEEQIRFSRYFALRVMLHLQRNSSFIARILSARRT